MFHIKYMRLYVVCFTRDGLGSIQERLLQAHPWRYRNFFVYKESCSRIYVEGNIDLWRKEILLQMSLIIITQNQGNRCMSTSEKTKNNYLIYGIYINERKWKFYIPFFLPSCVVNLFFASVCTVFKK